MKLIVKNSPIENKILLLLGLEGLNKQKVMFTRLGKNNKAFRYLNSLPLKKNYNRLFNKTLSFRNKRGGVAFQ